MARITRADHRSRSDGPSEHRHPITTVGDALGLEAAKVRVGVEPAAGMTVRRISWRAAARLLDNESGFTIIELVMASVVLAIISAPVAGVLLAAAAQSKTAREE